MVERIQSRDSVPTEQYSECEYKPSFCCSFSKIRSGPPMTNKRLDQRLPLRILAAPTLRSTLTCVFGE